MACSVQGRQKKARQVKSKVKSMFSIFFDIKDNVHKEFIPTGQTVNPAYYRDILWRLHENVQRLHPEFWQENNWLLHHSNTPSHTSFFTREFLTRKNMTVIPHPPYFSFFPRLKIKLKGHHFDTIEVNEAELQAGLNALKVYDFQDGFIKWHKHWEQCIRAEGGYF
jgi:hypothetical protein